MTSLCPRRRRWPMDIRRMRWKPTTRLAAEVGSDQVDEEVHSMFHKEPFVVPNKSQVLFYFSSANTVKIARTGSELQVTDSADFPLFDIWAEPMCTWTPGPWVMEAYGRRVLRMDENGSGGGLPCLRRPSLPSHITLSDWNNDVIGYVSEGSLLHVLTQSRNEI